MATVTPSLEAYPGLQSLHSPTESIRDLLHSNIEPEPAVSKQLQANLVHAVKEFEEISSQWPESQRTRHEGAIRLHRNALSVVRRLPNDILRLIFLAVVEDVKPCDRLDTKAGAWSVSHVCARWREVALLTPSLWSTIHLLEGKWLTDLPMSTVSAIVDVCLSRTGRAPLDLSVFHSASDQLRFIPVCSAICLHASHWEYATFCPLSDSMLDSLATVQSVPLLKQITFVITSASIDPRDKRLDFLFSAPRLQHVCLLYSCSQDTQLPLHFPWEQLLSFTLTTEAAILKLSEVLPRCSRLLDLRINCPDFVPATSPVVLPCLTSLTLWLKKVVSGLEYVIVPSLKHLTLGVFSIDAETDVSMILENSRCSLLEFHYYCFGASVSVINRYLKAVPTLRMFALDIYRFGVEQQRDLLLLLTCREDEEVIAPELEDLTITLRDFRPPDLTELWDAMVVSRSTRGNFKAHMSA